MFKLIKDEVDGPAARTGLSDYYALPNVARRVLEWFLAFRYPDSPDLRTRLERVEFDPERKTRVLRLLHMYSHADAMSDQGHDPTVLSETKMVLADILALIETTDGQHYKDMVSLLNRHSKARDATGKGEVNQG